MMNDFSDSLQKQIDEAVRCADEDALQALLVTLYRPDFAETSAAPFAPRLELKQATRNKLINDGLEGDNAINWANSISRAIRRIRYDRKTEDPNFSGIRIVAEGDSWFQYPLLLEDIIDRLSKDYDKAVLSLGGAGHLIEDMVRQSEYPTALAESRAPILLFSAGGNDMLGGGRLRFSLHEYEEGLSATELVNEAAFDATISSIIDHYSTILNRVAREFPRVHVFGHGYDVPFPIRDEKWLWQPLNERGIPARLGRDIIRIMVDRFNEELSALERVFSNFKHVNLRGVIGDSRNSWSDELHPHNAGYGRAADKFREAFSSANVESAHLFSGRAEPHSTPDRVEMSEPRKERITSNTYTTSDKENNAMAVIVLDPGHGGKPPPVKLGGSSWNNARGPNGMLEKTITLDIAKRTRDELEARGHTVYLTRNGDNNLSLKDRASAARTRSADVFLSSTSTGIRSQFRAPRPMFTRRIAPNPPIFAVQSKRLL